MNPENYLYLSVLLFTIGAAGVLLRRQRHRGVHVYRIDAQRREPGIRDLRAQCTAIWTARSSPSFTMVVAAAEVVVGLAIIMIIFRSRRSVSVDDADLLKY